MASNETGVVITWVPAPRNFGFIRQDGDNLGEDVFVHVTNCPHQQPLSKGQKVTFTIGPGRNGMQAMNVELLTTDGTR